MSLSRASTAFGGAGATLLHGKAERLKERASLREADIAESRSLLLELALYDPGVQQCINLIANFVLSEEIMIAQKGMQMTDAFRKFVHLHWLPFAHDAICCFYLYGFVAWHPRKLVSGDVVPSIVPHGLFTWYVSTHSEDNARRQQNQRRNQTQNQTQQVSGQAAKSPKRKHSEPPRKSVGPEPLHERWSHIPVPASAVESKQLHYTVQLVNCDIEPEDVFVFEVATPSYNVSTNSVLYATVPSPLSHIIVDYKNLRDALIRRAYADAWNTTARVFTSCQPPPQTSNEPTQSYLYYETGSANNRINAGRSFMESRYAELERQVAQPSNHVPSLYNLPIHHRLEQLSSLQPCEDVPFLLEKYRRDICNVIGVPFEMVFGRIGTSHSTGSAQADVAGRMFTNTVYRVCKQLESLIAEAYSTIYGVDINDVDVHLNPMPRLDIRSIDDIKVLWEMGAVTPDIMAQLSEVLLISDTTSSTGKHRKTTHAPGAYLTNLKEINKAQQPPKPLAPSSSSKSKKPKKKKTSSS